MHGYGFLIRRCESVVYGGTATHENGVCAERGLRFACFREMLAGRRLRVDRFCLTAGEVLDTLGLAVRRMVAAWVRGLPQGAPVR